MSTRTRLLALLANGSFHSGTELGAALGISRAAVNKNVGALARAGVDIHRVRGRGYKLADPIAPLDAGVIGEALRRRGIELPKIDLLEEVDSTNRYLMGYMGVQSGQVCLAEAQHQGRGRRGSSWIATPYSNLMLSLAWRFELGPAALAGFSLAAGLAVLKALEAYGVTGAGLKWPNDILWGGRKLAGLLAEIQAEAEGPSLVVIGVGINGRVSASDGARIDQPWVDLGAITGAVIDRNRLAALVIEQLVLTCREYAAAGFARFHREWEQHHVLQGRQVQVVGGEMTRDGVVTGVDAHGALRLRDSDGSERVFHSGEVSLRG